MHAFEYLLVAAFCFALGSCIALVARQFFR